MTTERTGHAQTPLEPRPFSEMRDTGVLWAINKYLFHPQGFAFALHLDDNGVADGWTLLGDGTEDWVFESDEPEATRFAEFRRGLTDAAGD